MIFRDTISGPKECIGFQLLQIGRYGMSIGVGIKGLSSCLIDFLES